MQYLDVKMRKVGGYARGTDAKLPRHPEGNRGR